MKSIQKHKPHLEISFDFRLLYFIKIKYKTQWYSKKVKKMTCLTLKCLIFIFMSFGYIINLKWNISKLN